MNDTSPEVERKYQEILMAKSPLERMAMASRMFSDAKKLVEISIIREKGNLGAIDMKVELLKRFYVSDFSEAELSKIIAWLHKMSPECD